eukprot:Lankesteria_metandrocarpae@DN8290_c0_g1_i1.p1
MAQNDQLSRKRKFIKDGVFQAELNEFLSRTLAEDGYSGVEVRVTPTKTEIIISATRPRAVLGDRGRRIRELTAVVQKRFGFAPGSVDLLADRLNYRGLCAMAQAESLRYKLLKGLTPRRACFGVLRQIMEAGAEGCEIIVSGKLRGQRAKSVKFKDGYILSTGEPVRTYVNTATRCVMMRQGMMGVKVQIMLPYDPEGIKGPSKRLPDSVIVREPKPDATQRSRTAYQGPSSRAGGVAEEPQPVVIGGGF